MKKYAKMGLVIWVVLLIAIFIMFFVKPEQEKLTEEDIQAFQETDYGENYFDYVNENFISGGPPKDGIPSIDEPTYVTVEEADVYLEDNELIYGFDYNGIVKAFPQNIMYWHEIVNEEVNGEKLSVTYCPLTGTVIGFKNKELGVSGKLFNSNLVIYDRETDSDIPQILEQGVNGPLRGQELNNFYVYTTTWGQWKQQYPHSLVLSEDTGFNRDYSEDPYPGYDTLLQIWFPVAAENDAFHSKKVIHGVVHNGESLAIPKENFKEVGEGTYDLGGTTLTITYDDNLDVITVHTTKGTQVNSYDSYWFAWYAYHPETKIYGV